MSERIRLYFSNTSPRALVDGQRVGLAAVMDMTDKEWLDLIWAEPTENLTEPGFLAGLA